jgi:hypothetical protein
MAYAYVQDVAASWEQYKRVAGSLVEPTPAGLILHIAGPTDEPEPTFRDLRPEHVVLRTTKKDTK